jgi:2-dehydro-3-deoxygluconokinase
MKHWDVITFGETMLRLSPGNFQTLEQAEEYEVRCAGSESNVAVGLCRLGLRAAWFSKLVDNPLGRKIANSLRFHGVDTSHVIWTNAGRVGTAFMELGTGIRPSEVIYDRAQSVASQLQESEIGWAILSSARHLHVTGITAALSASCADCVAAALRHARQQGLSVSLDVNYRRKLWTTQRAAEILSPMMPGLDVLFITAEDAAQVCGLSGEPEDVVRELAKRYGASWTVMTLGGEGAVARVQGQTCREKAVPTSLVDRIGAGDAFVAGYLCGYLEGDPTRALRYGLAMAALKMTTPGDLSFATRQQVDDVLSGRSGSVKR